MDARLSLLKLLAALAVVLVHTTMVRVSQVDVHSAGWWLANVGDAAGRIGSAMFAMVGGAVLLARPSEQAPWRFIGQRMARLLPAVAFWSVFYFAWRQWMWGGIDWSVIRRDLVLGSPWYHLWFMYMMLGLYLVAPALRLVVKGVGEGPAWRYVLVVAAGMTWFASAAQTLQGLSHASFIGLVPFFVVYFLAGYYLLRRPVHLPSRWLWLGGGLCIAAMALGVAWSYPHLREGAFVLFYSNRSPFAMGLTFCVFLLVARLQPRALPAWVNRLGAATLGVYAIHPFWIDMLGRWGWSLQRAGDGWIVLTLLVFALSMVTSLGLSAVPGLRRLVN
ncbi:acyltransferase [Pulveribacter suum]|uniref:acyltransferase n=1 Tax=Pulveribacter suum TaxID=2116657 RepID=UPI00130061DE|nr:acyltransferase [Pulveribacter suum]